MPSLAESRQQVRDHLDKEVDHDALLAGLQDEIDKHNAVKHELRSSLFRKARYTRDSSSPERSPPPERPTKFRFKAGKDDSRDRRKHRHRSKRDDDSEDHHKRKRRRHADREQTEEGEPTHPFPREPADPAVSQSDAFRASLFDALADDEGAAAYWENIYSQPIHVYPRPNVENPATGKLEGMNDDEYVEYVKQQMWERKHPEIVHERKKRERERKEEEENRTRRREEFIRRKEQASWERSQRRRFNDRSEDGRYEYEFAGEKDFTSNAPSTSKAEEAEYRAAWPTYLAAWDKLKRDLLAQRNNPSLEDTPPLNPSKRIPWPVLASKAPTRPNIEAFMQRVPGENGKEKLRLLKAERVRWHPDKVQQRFGGAVDEGTMKIVTGVFQVVDDLVEVERQRVEGG